MVLLVWNPRSKRVLQPIVNPNLTYTNNVRHTSCKYEMRKRKGGYERKQIFDMKIYPMVDIKPSLVHVVETLNQEYSFSATKSLPWFFLTRHKGYVKSSRPSWSRFSLRSFSMKDGGLHVPRTKPSSPLHTKLEGQWLAGEPPRLQGGRLLVFCNITNKIRKRTDTFVVFTQEYSRVSYPQRNVSTLSTVQVHLRTHTSRIKRIERISQGSEPKIRKDLASPRTSGYRFPLDKTRALRK
jgi:hypothetical protein